MANWRFYLSFLVQDGHLGHLSYTQLNTADQYNIDYLLFSAWTITDTTMTQERRRFRRIDFDARVEVAQGDNNWQAQLLDISLKGLLLSKIGPYQLQPDTPVLVKIILSDQTSIAMSAQVVHQTLEQLHVACVTIDIDSISHLRRLIELNIGDASAAERELSELLAESER